MMRRGAAALAGAAMLSMAAAADASSREMKTARFAVTVSGTQTTVWKEDRTTYDGCVDGDVRTTGGGTQRFTFRSARPATLNVVKVGRDVVVSAGSTGIPVRGAVTQRGSLSIEQLSGGESACGGTPNPRPMPAPDCGTRPWRGRIDPVVHTREDFPGPGVPRGRVLVLAGPSIAGDTTFTGLFRNCPGSEGLLPATRTSAFPVARVFSNARRIVIRASATVVEEHDGSVATITVRWTAVLARRGRGTTTGRPGAPACANGRDDDGDGRADYPQDRGCRDQRDRSER